jgi:hypothetical protein
VGPSLGRDDELHRRVEGVVLVAGVDQLFEVQLPHIRAEDLVVRRQVGPFQDRPAVIEVVEQDELLSRHPRRRLHQHAQQVFLLRHQHGLNLPPLTALDFRTLSA